MVKIPTQWYNPNRQGTYTLGSNEFLVTNSGKFLVTNSGAFLVTNLGTPVAKPSTSWTNSVKNDTSWVNASIGNVNLGAINNIADPSGNLLIDTVGNFIVDTGVSVTSKPSTSWVNQ